MHQKAVVACVLILCFGAGVCVGESFNFEVARRTHDRLANYLNATSFPTAHLAKAFELGWLNSSLPTFYSDAREWVWSLLVAVPDVSEVLVMCEGKMLGIIRTDNMLLTTESIFGGFCPGVIGEGSACVHLATLDDLGNPTTSLGAQNILLSQYGIVIPDSATWSEIRKISLFALGVHYSRPIFNDNGARIGMVSAGVTINNLDSFLFEAFGNEQDGRIVYIVERTTHKLVAASVSNTSTTFDTDFVQVLASECSNQLIRESSGFLFDLPNLEKEVLGIYNSYYIQSTRYVAVGIDWLIVVVRPADLQDYFISMTSNTYLVFCVVVGLFAAVTLFLMAWVVRFRNLRLWKAGQPEALLLVLFSNLCCIFAALCMLGPMTDTLCLVRQWLLPWALFLSGSSLIAKLLRVYISTKVSNLGKKGIINLLQAKHVVAITSFIMLVESGFLVAWTIVDPYRSQLKYHTQVGVIVSYAVCGSDSNGWIVFNSIFGLGMIMTGCYLSFVTRNVSEMFAESRALMTVFFHGTFVGIVLVFVITLGNISVKSATLFLAIGFLWAAISTQILLFFPRIYRQVTLGDFSQWEMKEFLVKHLNKENPDRLKATASSFLPEPKPRVIFGQTNRVEGNASTSNVTAPECNFVI